jgi:tight adherence protein C
MDALFNLLRDISGGGESLRLLFIFVAAVTAVVLTVGVAFLFISTMDPVRRRIGDLGPRESDAASQGRVLVDVQTMLGPMAQYVVPKDEIERNKVTQQLVHAGYRSPTALQTYYAIKAVGAILLPIIVIVAAQWLPKLTTTQVIVAALTAGGLGLLAPSSVLPRLVESRLKKLRNGFPDALDLMVVSVEAGLGMTQAIQRVADELGVSHPELAIELSLVNAETRAGIDRVTALRNLADRTGLDDLRGLVSLLVQTLRFGTSVADSLRVYSEEFRDRRMQRAEEVAATMGTRMMFPLILFLFPGFFVVAVGPAILALANAFASM